MNRSSDTTQGLAAALLAFLLWGLFPLYWKLLDFVPALETMLHRVAWCFVFVGTLVSLQRGMSWWSSLTPGLLLRLGASGMIISINWFLYIWAINNHHIVETSLGYYINPLVNVALGTVLLKEKLNRTQWSAVALASAGVIYLTIMHGRLPWIALILACSFALYGFMRKHTDIDAIRGLAVEGAVLFPFTLLGLGYLHLRGEGLFLSASPGTQGLMVLGGLITAIPLLLFAFGARRIPYSTVGMLQYLAPSIQLLLGVLVFDEAFNRDSLIGFTCIWLALSLYTSDGIRRMARSTG